MSYIGRLDPLSRPGLVTWMFRDTAARDELTEAAPGIRLVEADIGRICRVGAKAPYRYYELVGVDPLEWAVQSDLSKTEADQAYAASDHQHDNATDNSDGFMSSADKKKLDGVDEGATDDQTAEEIKQAYESNSDTNAYTDADKAKLESLQTQVDQLKSQVEKLQADSSSSKDGSSQ